MGLITGLITLPLAPVRATTWLAERVLEEAEREYYDEGTIMAQLAEIDEARAEGTMDEEEARWAEDELLERLIEGRELREAASYG